MQKQARNLNDEDKTCLGAFAAEAPVQPVRKVGKFPWLILLASASRSVSPPPAAPTDPACDRGVWAPLVELAGGG